MTLEIMDSFIKRLLWVNYVLSSFFFKDGGVMLYPTLYFIAFWHFEVLSYCSHHDAIKHKQQLWTTKFCSPLRPQTPFSDL